MKRFLLIVCISSSAWAAGPKYMGPTPTTYRSSGTVRGIWTPIYQEFVNAYHDIQNVPNGVYHSSSMTLQGLSVDSVTVNSKFTGNGSFTTTNGNITSFSPAITRTGTAINPASDSLVTLLGKLIQYRIIQVVPCTTTSIHTTTSNTFVATNLSCAITPAGVSDGILILATSCGDSNASAIQEYVTLQRGATNLGSSNGFLTLFHTATGELKSGLPLVYFDSPSTTSAITYAVYHKNSDGASAVDFGCSGNTQYMLLIDVGAGT